MRDERCRISFSVRQNEWKSGHCRQKRQARRHRLVLVVLIVLEAERSVAVGPARLFAEDFFGGD